jgi:hypothetical protein
MHSILGRSLAAICLTARWSGEPSIRRIREYLRRAADKNVGSSPVMGAEVLNPLLSL